MRADPPEAPARLRVHEVVLTGPRVRLRPMSEADWPVLLAWNQDPRVAAFSDGNTVPWTRESLERIYRGISRNAFMFVLEHAGSPVGEAWLQRMNLAALRDAFPGQDVRRVDLSLGRPDLWGRGLGSETIGLLVDFAFRTEGIDVLFACDVAVHNPRSRRAFERFGFVDFGPDGHGGSHLFLARDRWTSGPGRAPVPGAR